MTTWYAETVECNSQKKWYLIWINPINVFYIGYFLALEIYSSICCISNNLYEKAF